MDAEAQSFSYAAQLASDSLYDLNSQLRKSQKLSSRDGSELLANSMAQLGAQTSKTTDIVNKATSWRDSDLNSSSRKQKLDLNTELEGLLHRVKQLQSSVADKLKQQQFQQNVVNQGSSQRVSGASESTPLLGEQQVQQQVLDQVDRTALDLHSALVEERDSEIADIQRGAHEINAIFRDLGILVTEQGQQLDTVEDNIADLAQQTESAGRQLSKAKDYQSSRGKWSCYFLLFLLVITIIIGINVVS